MLEAVVVVANTAAEEDKVTMTAAPVAVVVQVSELP